LRTCIADRISRHSAHPSHRVELIVLAHPGSENLPRRATFIINTSSRSTRPTGVRLLNPEYRFSAGRIGFAYKSPNTTLTSVHCTAHKHGRIKTQLSPTLFAVMVNFYRAMLCIRGSSHGPVSVCVRVRLCPSVCHKSEFY